MNHHHDEHETEQHDVGQYDAYLPKGDEVWLVFDKSNGDELTHRYVWWFDTEEEANGFINETRKRKLSATLSQPIKYQRAA